MDLGRGHLYRIKHPYILFIDLSYIILENFFYAFKAKLIFCHKLLSRFLKLNAVNLRVECRNIGFYFFSFALPLVPYTLDKENLVWNDTKFTEGQCLSLCTWEANEHPVFGLTVLLKLLNLASENFNYDFVFKISTLNYRLVNLIFVLETLAILVLDEFSDINLDKILA